MDPSSGDEPEAIRYESERLLYVTDSDGGRDYDVRGYYVRIASIDASECASRFNKRIHGKNLAPGKGSLLAVHQVSPDLLVLVRFGLRSADDPRILDTIKLVDSLLKVETAQGPIWHRYNGDGYGQQDNGEPFDSIGRGRAWPLLTGERAHFELVSGRIEEARRLQGTFESLASAERLFPEQTWTSLTCQSASAFRLRHASCLGTHRVSETTAFA